MNRRHVLKQVASVPLLGISGHSLAQSSVPVFPSRPVRILVPWPAGGLVDIAARQLQGRLRTAWPQPVVVENRVGAGGSLGADLVAKSAADGHTLLLSSSALTINAALKSKTAFNLSRDLEALALVAYAPSVLIVGPSLAVTSVRELTDQIRKQPGRLTYASAGVGSPAHLTAELFKVREKLFVVHVPYTGAPAAMTDQVAGRIDFQFANMAVALPQIRAGRVRALAVTSAKRHAALAAIPTMGEAGVTDFEADQWLAVLAPRGLPKSVSDTLSSEIQKVLGQEDFRQSLAQAGMTAAAAASPADFERFLRQDEARWASVIKAQGIQAD